MKYRCKRSGLYKRKKGLRKKCMKVLRGLQQHQHGWRFNTKVEPVDPMLTFLDYNDIIKKHMYLGTVQKRLEKGKYQTIKKFATDINLTFDNAISFNFEGSATSNMAIELKNKFSCDLKNLYCQLEAEDRQNMYDFLKKRWMQDAPNRFTSQDESCCEN